MGIEHRKFEIPLRSPVRSLCWGGDSLIDWVGGGRVLHLDGTETREFVNWAYKFDAAIQSPTGRFVCIYERLGTKAILIDSGELLRELNRSFYHAHVYEYPIVFFQHADGRELIAHCPDDYNRLEIDEVTTGERLTMSINREPDDFFHSRLSVSPDGKYLLSCGWIWHPVDSASVWSIAEALSDCHSLDKLRPPHTVSRCDISSGAFVDAHRIVISSNPDVEDFGVPDGSPFRPGSLAIFNVETELFETVTKLDQITGDILWLGDGKLVSFYESPKVLDTSTGDVLESWPGIFSGRRKGNIGHDNDRIPPIAIDPIRKRFAVAADDRITVLEF